MLIDTGKFKEELKKLWHNVFGDGEEYISLLFDYSYTPKECFAHFDNGRIVSVLYLLESEILCEDESYKGRYLYAAATEKSHRGKGFMALLIKEAQDFCQKENLDFISLVPANDHLYSYYSKFGFCENMYRFVFKKENCSELCKDCGEEVSFREYFSKRKEYLKNGFHFSFEETVYASSCLGQGGIRAYKNSDNSFYLADKTEGTVLEYISDADNFNENTLHFFERLEKGTTVSSPYDLSKYGETKKERYGMVYPVSSFFKEKRDKSFYMNIALD